MKVYEKENSVVIEGALDFDPKHIFECGQCFRWKAEEDGSYTGVAKGRVINVSREGNTVYLKNTNLEDFNKIWKSYFDLETDYAKIKNELKSMDEYLEKATEFGWGIRILRQDPWEMLISFIISSNNRIPMIQKAISNLSREYGTYIGKFNGVEYYDFPTPEQLSKASIADIRACSTGFRDKYIKATTERVISENEDVYNYENLGTEDCRKKLMEFNGVGPKVCDCIALFGMQKYDTFPVDVWVKRVMQEFYVEDDMSLPKIRKYAIDKFEDLSGFAQQYLFYYARELGIGR
ncbi:MAG: 8-oxoguanine DNA glycosylase [Paraclostridium bifermentans]|jgi:N-glycosylase/DNA lyase|uniref:DNA-3-methyladenine glycosylase family protein n=1 Tax=Paraclostridium bifermentans TaxID=1490 RepID=UPI001DB380FF|nr:DNA glycosylase [Paraclostridium bifermentans]MBS6509050.1 8-oxoguanine DNA glycosylase [Paraclostridium bifermentans]MDU3337427.1 DNA glycosylase [Paraclostridium bifermentans]MDU3803394.1 DNA glycosylase [Paraclostridium bifermentans]